LVAVRSVTVQAKALPGAFRGAKRPGVMRAIKGNIGAERAEKWNSFEKIAVKQGDNARNSLNPVECGSCGFFRRRGAEQKKML
jgi:hypothetical protein